MEALSEFAFVRICMIASMVAFAWFGLAFPVGILRGSRAGALVLVVGLWIYLAVLVGTFVWAVVDGEWAAFSASLGVGTLFEMGVFVAIWQFVIYFMASRYLSDKRRREIEASKSTETVHA